MIIHDLEFLNCCDQKYQNSNIAITGGASSSSSVNIDASDGAKYAQALVKVTGDDSYSIAVVDDKIIKKHGKKGAKVKLSDYGASYNASYDAGYCLADYF